MCYFPESLEGLWLCCRPQPAQSATQSTTVKSTSSMKRRLLCSLLLFRPQLSSSFPLLWLTDTRTRAVLPLLCSSLNQEDEEATLDQPQLASSCSSRRYLLAVSSSIATTAACITSSSPAYAARGAAELDLEYYWKNLVGGSATAQRASPLPAVAPPRTLKEPFTSTILNRNGSNECLTTQALLQVLQQTSRSNSNQKPQQQKDTLDQAIMDTLDSYRKAAERAFYARTPWDTPSVADEYYLNITMYAMWKTAAELLPNSTDRDLFIRTLGVLVYDRCATEGWVRQSTTTTTTAKTLTETNANVQELLHLFQSNGWIQGYRWGDDPQATTTTVPFDALDDEAMANGGSVDVLLTLESPATLGASVQLTGERTRFTPCVMATTLAAAVGGSKNISWDMYFVDSVYRPNPNDYVPNEQLYQFTVSSAR